MHILQEATRKLVPYSTSCQCFGVIGHQTGRILRYQRIFSVLFSKSFYQPNMVPALFEGFLPDIRDIVKITKLIVINQSII